MFSCGVDFIFHWTRINTNISHPSLGTNGKIEKSAPFRQGLHWQTSREQDIDIMGRNHKRRRQHFAAAISDLSSTVSSKKNTRPLCIVQQKTENASTYRKCSKSYRPILVIHQVFPISTLVSILAREVHLKLDITPYFTGVMLRSVKIKIAINIRRRPEVLKSKIEKFENLHCISVSRICRAL